MAATVPTARRLLARRDGLPRGGPPAAGRRDLRLRQMPPLPVRHGGSCRAMEPVAPRDREFWALLEARTDELATGAYASQQTAAVVSDATLAHRPVPQVCFELGVHGRHAEEPPTDGVVRVMDRPTGVRGDLPRGQLVGHRPGVRRRRAKPSSLVTTGVSPSRQAASASRRHGRSQLVPVNQWSTYT